MTERGVKWGVLERVSQQGQIVSAGSAKPALGALKQSLDSRLSEKCCDKWPISLCFSRPSDDGTASSDDYR